MSPDFFLPFGFALSFIGVAAASIVIKKHRFTPWYNMMGAVPGGLFLLVVGLATNNIVASFNGTCFLLLGIPLTIAFFRALKGT
ncbi:MAG: hypothetical protein U0228_05125 [Myxococcaceae bacterium]